MAIKVQIPTPMREQAGGKAEVEVSGGTVKAALDDLTRQYPGLLTKTRTSLVVPGSTSGQLLLGIAIEDQRSLFGHSFS